VYELAKQIIKDEPSEVKKKFSKANAVVSENIDYINEVRGRGGEREKSIKMGKEGDDDFK